MVLMIALCFTLASCGDTPDQNPDGTGDPSNPDTGDVVSPYLDLTKDGDVLFAVIYKEKDSNIKREVDKLVDAFKAKGLTVKALPESDTSTISGCEILVGDNLKNREDYAYDTTEVGSKGFSYFVKENKIIIAGGSSESTANGLKVFTSDVLRVESSASDINNISVERTMNYVKKTTYRITSISIMGTPISEFTIVTSSDSNEVEAAEYFRDNLYNYTGIKLETSQKTQEKNNIFFRLVDNAGKDGFKAYTKDGDLYVDCAFFNSFMKGTESFVSAKLIRANGDVKFGKDFEYTVEVSKIYYEDFGAKGDGMADDFYAIKAAHDYANVSGHTVVATPNATYNMGVHKETIHVKTNVIWTGARFIVDDSSIEKKTTESKTHIFTISPSKSSQKVETVTSLSAGQTKIDGVSFDGPMLVYLCDKQNDDRRVYIRYGGNANSGSLRQEVILIDKDGNVDPSTPILWDYPEIGSFVAYPVDEDPVTIKGGIFTNICNLQMSTPDYYARGINVRRSNTTVVGVTHYMSGEPDNKADPDGACPYTGFICVTQANNVRIESCVFTGHTTYKTQKATVVSQGSYDTTASNSNNVTWYQCTQTNDILDTSKWGVMSTNFCKNLKYDGCKLSRFDAHQGMHNTTIINSELGHQKINAIGSGLLRIENCIVNGNTVVSLRGDYGSTWSGDVIIKDVNLATKDYVVTVFAATYNNHYFGYTCYLPQNVTIDNLTVDSGASINVFPTFPYDDISGPTVGNAVNLNPTVMPKKVTVVNSGGYKYSISQNANPFANTEFIIEK